MRISDWSSDVCSSDLCCASIANCLSCTDSGTRRLFNVSRNASKLKVEDDEEDVECIRFSDAFTRRRQPYNNLLRDRKSVVQGKSVSVRVDLGGRRIIQKKRRTRVLRTNNTPQH